jgi:DNA-binding XRE family transcriptional regulator
MSIMKTIECTPERLRALRATAGLSRAGFSKLTGIPVKTLEKWEARPDAAMASKPWPVACVVLEQYLLIQHLMERLHGKRPRAGRDNVERDTAEG